MAWAMYVAHAGPHVRRAAMEEDEGGEEDDGDEEDEEDAVLPLSAVVFFAEEGARASPRSFRFSASGRLGWVSGSSTTTRAKATTKTHVTAARPKKVPCQPKSVASWGTANEDSNDPRVEDSMETDDAQDRSEGSTQSAHSFPAVGCCGPQRSPMPK
jgi:hypothetical protein